jgi:ABC-type antimicrobial peptide transport system permease subunit
VRRGLFIGAVVTLLLIGLSLLVGVLEQLRDRRRLLAVLSAVGARRGTLGWSVLWQTALPVALGLLLAVPSGIGLGWVLLAMVREPLRVNPAAVAGMAGAAGAVVVLVTAASLPALWRIMRAEGLRTE